MKALEFTVICDMIALQPGSTKQVITLSKPPLPMKDGQTPASSPPDFVDLKLTVDSNDGFFVVGRLYDLAVKPR